MPRKIIADTVDWAQVEIRLDSTLRAATSEQWAEGTRWYASARHIAETLVCFSDLTVSHGAGIIAALSPQSNWAENVRQATELCLGNTISNTADRLGKAAEILSGADPDQILNGPKERAFWLSISEPISCRSACIDRHMVRAALGVSSDEEIRLWLGRAQVYDRIAAAVAAVADRYSLPVPTTQAIIWVVVRDSRLSTSKG